MNSHSDIFSFHRWWLLVTKHWSENYRRYLLFLLAIGGLLLAWFSFILMVSQLILIDTFMQFAAYFAGLYLVGCFYASWLFADLSSTQGGIGFLSLPASHLEKLLCALFFGVILFFIGYTLVFYLVDIPILHLSNSILVKYPRNYQNTTLPIQPAPLYNVFSNQAFIPETRTFLAGFFSAQALFFLGSVYFTRWTFIRSVIVGLLCLLTFVVIDAKLINFFLPSGWHDVFFLWVYNDADQHPVRYVRLPHTTGKILNIFIAVCAPLFLWIITWQRLKEKEV
ncbi:MAG: hypothetical protein JST42_14280 [Bacteroidetes bacterium]|nr:hypothetical protein [Bacteroidota bacterium]